MGFMEFFDEVVNAGEISNDTLKKINDTISNAGGEAFVVGGPVRDTLLGKNPKDIDFMVRLIDLDSLNDLMNTIGSSQITGQRFGVITANIDGEEFEFALPRPAEGSTRQSDVVVDPEAEPKDDLGRRDLTINSIAVPLDVFMALRVIPDASERASKLKSFIEDNKDQFDPYDGLGSLERRELKVTGSAENRFNEDPIRMLRAARFAARTGFVIDQDAIDAMKKMKDELIRREEVKGEPIATEFLKAWADNGDLETFWKILDTTGIAQMLFGDDIDPFIVKLPNLKGKEAEMGHFIATFLNGGEFDKFFKEADPIKALNFAQFLTSWDEKFPPFQVVAWFKKKDILNVITEVFREIDPKISKELGKMQKFPMSLGELDISGHDISRLGIKGKDIGTASEHLLKGVWSGDIPNEKPALVDELKNNVNGKSDDT